MRDTKAGAREAPALQPRNLEPISSRLCDVGVLAFALWTLCCNAVGAAGGTLPVLLIAFAVLCVTICLARYLVPDRMQPRTDRSCAEAETSGRTGRFERGLVTVGLAAGIGCTLAYCWHGHPIALWWCLAVVLGCAAVAVMSSEPPRVAIPAAGRGQEIGLWSLASLCVLLTLMAHRFDVDDSFYVNLAVAAAEQPGWPLLSTDTLHGIEGLPIHLPVYRLQSYELLNGAVSYLLRVPAIYCFHWIFAALGALLVPLAHARLFRLLTPKQWLFSVVYLILVLVVVGAPHRWYGNFAFVRMWQGKAFFLFVFTPLIYSYALEFARQPSWRKWLLLSSAQIAAMGCNATALWAAPLGALAAVVCALPLRRESVRTLAWASLASAYVLGAGLIVKGAVTASLPSLASPGELGAQLQRALALVLGRSELQTVGIAAILIAWVCTRPGLGRRFAIGVPLVVTLLLNPYASSWITDNVTGNSYWRLLWAMPIPTLIALVLVSPLQVVDSFAATARSRGQECNGSLLKRLGVAMSLLLTLTFAVLVPRYTGLDPANRVRLGLPGLKVEHPEYDLAAVLNRSVAAGSHVVAPKKVSLWIPTFQQHAYPLQVRHYLSGQAAQLGERVIQARQIMTLYVDGELDADYGASVFQSGLAAFDVKGVCLRRSPANSQIQAILREAGFRKTFQRWNHQIWVRE